MIRKLQNFSLLPFILLGCESNYGIPDAQLLTNPLEPSYRVDASADKVWIRLSEHAELFSDCGIQAKLEQDFLMSWCEKVKNWRDLGQDTVHKPCSAVGCGNPDQIAEWSQNPGTGVALTSVWIEPRGSYSLLHIQRVYFGGKRNYAKIAHSRGDYEHDLHQWIVHNLDKF